MAINQIKHNDVKYFAAGKEPENDINSFDYYQELATRTAIYPGQGTALGLAYVALKMNGEAGEFAEHVGKAMRDDGYVSFIKALDRNGDEYDSEADLNASLTPERRALLIKEVGDVLWYLSAACNELGISLFDAAVGNLEKLADRAERGKLQGSGDER